MKEMLKQYTTLTENKLEDRLVKELTDDVRKSVRRSQEAADNVVNAMTQKGGADNERASSAVALLIGAPHTIAEHWKPFIAATIEQLPKEMRPKSGVVPNATMAEHALEAELTDVRDQLHQSQENERQADIELDLARVKAKELETKLEGYVTLAKSGAEKLADLSKQAELEKRRADGLEQKLNEALKKKK
jgi:hypothetical protein